LKPVEASFVASVSREGEAAERDAGTSGTESEIALAFFASLHQYHLHIPQIPSGSHQRHLRLTFG
jgi:hypothetical protein